MKTITVILAATLASCATHESASEVRIYHLKVADVQQVVRTIAQEEKARKSETLEIAGDARTNSVMVKASKEVLDRLDARIRELHFY